MKLTKSNLKVQMAINNIEFIKDLAELTGISRNSLTKYCSVEGIETITLKNLLKLCTVFNCSIDDLINVEEGE